MQVDVVERRLDLVHHVERRRAAAEHGEQERERGEAALTARQQRQLLHVLAARLGLDLDAGVEQVVGHGQLELARAAGEERREQVGEVLADVGERRGEHRLDLLVDRLDDPAEFAACRPHVFELLFEERVPLLQLVVLLERERVDRSEQSQLAVEFTNPTGGRGPLGQLGLLRRLGDLGLDVEVAAQGLDGGLESELGLGLFDLGAVQLVPQLFEAALGVGAALAGRVERRREAAHLFALATASGDEVVVLHLDHRAVGVDQRGEPVDGDDRLLDLHAPLGGERAGFLVGLEPTLGLGDAVLEQALAFVEAGVTHFELAAARRQHGGTCLEFGTGLTTSLRRLGLGSFLGVERRQDRFEFGDARLLTVDERRELLDRAVEVLAFGGCLASLTEHARQPFGRRGEPGVVLVELPGQVGFGLASGRLALLRPAQRLFGGGQCLCALLGALLGVGQRGGGRAARGGADTPAGRGESIASGGDDDGGGVFDRRGDGGIDRVDADGSRDEGFQEPAHARTAGAHVRQHRVADRRRGDRAVTSTGSEDGTAGVGRLERFERSLRRLGVLDHDGGQGLAERRLDGLLPTLIDLDQVEEGAEHTVDAGEPFGAGTCVCGVEGELKGFDPSRRSRRRLVGVGAFGGEAFDVGVGLDAGVFGGGDLIDERRLDRLGLRTVGPQPFGVGLELFDAAGELFAPCGGTTTLALAAFDTVPDRAQLAAHLGGRAGGFGAALLVVEQGRRDLFALFTECSFVGFELFGFGLDLAEGFFDLIELGTELRCVAFEVRDHAGVEEGALVAFERSLALDEDGGEAACAFAELLDLHQAVGDVALTAGRQLGFERHDLGVEAGQFGLELTFETAGVEAVGGDRFELGAQPGDFSAGDEDAQRLEFDDDLAVAASGLGLAFERSQLTPDLTQQVLQAEQVRFGRIEATLGLLFPPTELEDAGGLFDDPASVLGASVEHRVDLALADDHVLLASDAGVGEQFLDVEEATRGTVDHVLAVAGAEQDTGDRDLVELDGQQAGRVVEREADLGPTEGGALLGSGEDDVVHLLGADRLGRLGAEHPRDRIDDVRLPGAVRADDHGHPGFEVHVGGVGERLEALEGEALQKHGGPESTAQSANPTACRVGRTGISVGSAGSSGSSVGRSR